MTVAVGRGLGGILGKYSAMVHWLTVEVPKAVYRVLLRRIYGSTVLKNSIGYVQKKRFKTTVPKNYSSKFIPNIHPMGPTISNLTKNQSSFKSTVQVNSRCLFHIK